MYAGEVSLQTQSGKLVKITLSTHDIRYSVQCPNCSCTPALLRSSCRHSRGSWSRSPSPLTTSGTVPQLSLHPNPTDVFLRTLSGKLVLSTYDIRYSDPTVPAPTPTEVFLQTQSGRLVKIALSVQCPSCSSTPPLLMSSCSADTVGKAGQDHPLHSRHQVQCPNCSCTPPPTDVFLQTQSGRLVKIALSVQCPNCSCTPPLLMSQCRHSQGGSSRSPSPLTTSGTVPQLFLLPTPTDVFQQTQSGSWSRSLSPLTTSGTVPQNWSCTPALLMSSCRHIHGGWSISPSPLTTSSSSNCSCNPKVLFSSQSKADSEILFLKCTVAYFQFNLVELKFTCYFS